MTKRVICLEKGKRYQFTFSKNVTKGTVNVETQDKKGGSILRFDDQTLIVAMIVEEKNRYQVVAKFVKADGEYTLRWNIK